MKQEIDNRRVLIKELLQVESILLVISKITFFSMKCDQKIQGVSKKYSEINIKRKEVYDLFLYAKNKMLIDIYFLINTIDDNRVKNQAKEIKNTKHFHLFKQKLLGKKIWKNMKSLRNLYAHPYDLNQSISDKTVITYREQVELIEDLQNMLNKIRKDMKLPLVSYPKEIDNINLEVTDLAAFIYGCSLKVKKP